MYTNALQAGDIVIMGTQSAAGAFTGAHTLMALGGDKFAESMPAGVGITDGFVPMNAAERETARAFRLGAGAGILANAASDAAYYAETWALPATTKYGEDRARGIKQYQIAAGLAAHVLPSLSPPPPFVFDALFRVLKWTTRGAEGTTFSRNKGITCCAFVVACYQAGMMLRLAQWDVAKIKAGFARVEALRVNKKDPDNYAARHVKDVYKGNSYEGYFKIERSNVGMVAPVIHAPAPQPTLAGLIRELLTGFENRKLEALLARAGDLTAADCFTPALAHDAKFYFSAQLYRALAADATWTALGPVENNP